MYHVVMADDERETLNLLTSLIHWEELGLFLLGTAENGNALCEKVDELSPHIVLIDMQMPGIHGAELIRHLKKNSPELKVIVISGYDDFSYTKAAIDSRISGYLLKPVEETELNQQLRQAVEELSAEQLQYRQRLSAAISAKKSRSILREQDFWNHLLQNDFTDRSIREFLPSADPGAQSFFQVCAFRIPNLQKVVLSPFQGDVSVLLFGIKNILDELFAPRGLCFYSSQTREILLLLTSPLPSAQLRGKLEEACGFLMKSLMLQAFAGVGKAGQDSSQLLSQYTSALYAVDNLDLFGSAHVAFFDEPPYPQSALYETILSDACQKSTTLFTHTVTEIYQAPRRYHINTVSAFFRLWNTVYKLCLTLPAVSRKVELRVALDNCHRKIRTEYATSGILPLWQSFSGLLAENSDDDIKIGRKIRRYVDGHYQENLSVAELADRCHVSRQHLTRIFKEETGLAPYAYIQNRKIEKSKALLLTSDLRITEIVSLLGFSDESHFSRIFKKITGMSPTQFRDQAGSPAAPQE